MNEKIELPPFECTKKDIDEIAKAIKRVDTRKLTFDLEEYTSRNCIYGYVMKQPNGFGVVKEQYQACYARISSNVNGEYPMAYLRFPKQSAASEYARFYIEWVTNFSPFRHIFITRDVGEMIKNEFALIRLDLGRDYTTGAAIAFRQFFEQYSEYPYKRHGTIRLQHSLVVDYGVEPNLAYILTRFFRATDAKLETFQLNEAVNGHTVLSSSDLYYPTFVKDALDIYHITKTSSGSASSIWKNYDDDAEIMIDFLYKCKNKSSNSDRFSNNIFDSRQYDVTLSFDKLGKNISAGVEKLVEKLEKKYNKAKKGT